MNAEDDCRVFFRVKEHLIKKMPKNNRSDKAATLPPEQLDTLMEELPLNVRSALSICRYTACRVSEALQLKWESITTEAVVIPRLITKKKMAMRSIPMNPRLVTIAQQWRSEWPAAFKQELAKSSFVFPGKRDFAKHLTRQHVDRVLRAACHKLDYEGVSTHSFRSSALTKASSEGVPLRVIQCLSGHSSLEQLQRYLDAKDEQKRQAALAFGWHATVRAACPLWGQIKWRIQGECVQTFPTVKHSRLWFK